MKAFIDKIAEQALNKCNELGINNPSRREAFVGGYRYGLREGKNPWRKVSEELPQTSYLCDCKIFQQHYGGFTKDQSLHWRDNYGKGYSLDGTPQYQGGLNMARERKKPEGSFIERAKNEIENEDTLMTNRAYELGRIRGRKETIDKACEFFAAYLVEIGYPDDWCRDSKVQKSGEQRFREFMEE